MVNRRFGKKLVQKKKASGFVYRPRSAETIKKRAERQGGRFDSPFTGNFDTFTPKQGENNIRILPPSWDGAHEDYGYTVWMHGWVGADGSSYLCPAKTVLPEALAKELKLSKKCPICNAAKRARDDNDDDEMRQLTATEKVICWIIDRDDEPSPKLWTISWSMDREINAQCYDRKKPDRALLLDHPDEGYDLQFRRTGVKLNTRYIGLKLDREPSGISEDPEVQEDILTFVQENPIPDLLKFYDTDYLENVISGTAEEKDEELDEETTEDEDEATTRKPKLRARGNSDGERDKSDDGDDEETTEDEDEPDEENGDEEEGDEEEAEGDEEEGDEEETEGDEEEPEDEPAEEERTARRTVVKKRPPPSRQPQRPPLRTSRGR